MARRNTAAAAPVAATDDSHAEPVNNSESEDSFIDSVDYSAEPDLGADLGLKDRGHERTQKPRLLWNSAMDDALTLAVKQTRSGPDVVRLLQSHEAFENFPASIITQGKIGGRLSKLRKAGVNVPKLKAGNGGGFQGQVYVPDVERLNRLLEGEDAGDAAPGGTGSRVV